MNASEIVHELIHDGVFRREFSLDPAATLERRHLTVDGEILKEVLAALSSTPQVTPSIRSSDVLKCAVGY